MRTYRNRAVSPRFRWRSLMAVAPITLAMVLSSACTQEKPAETEEPPKAGKTPTAAAAAQTPAQPAVDAAELLTRAKGLFQGPVPERLDAPNNPATEEKIALGRMLYYDKRLSKGQDISCNSCHMLDSFGIDAREPEGQRQVSIGHKGQKGDRNSPTVYNSALHFRQFWDGRAADLVEQAKGPVLNPVEMAMPSEEAVVELLKSIPGYVEAFGKAFPDAGKDAVSYDNMALAIAVFENGLMTPSPFDKFLAGDTGALNQQQLVGLKTFIDTGCIACHVGPGVGGSMYQKLGLIKPYETKDMGRFAVTQAEFDKFMFKVPTLRNIEHTAPYLHDGSIESLEEMVSIMAEHQTPSGKISEDKVKSIVTFLKALTGTVPTEYVAEPELPESGPKTPKPDMT